MYVHMYVRYIHLHSFSPRQFTPIQDTFFYNPIARALFSLYGDVIRNTYVTPKLIRYNFTDRLHLLSPPSSPSRRSAGWALRLTAAPTANQSAALPAPIIGFPRFSQLFLKSHTTLFPGPCSSFFRARASPRGRQAPFEEQSAGE